MTKGTIYNLCQDSEKHMVIHEVTGWIDKERKVGFFKYPNGRWNMTDLETGHCFTHRDYDTRKQTIMAYDYNLEKITNLRETDEYKKKIKIFYEELNKYKED